MGIRDLLAEKKQAVELQRVVGNECSVGIICTEDGSIRYFNDDGDGGVDRKKLQDMANERDAISGKVIWCLPKPMEAWTGKNGRRHPPIHFEVINDSLKAHIEESKELNEKFKQKGRLQNVALAEKAALPAKPEVKK